MKKPQSCYAVSIVIFLFISSCSTQKPAGDAVRDPHSFANTEDVVVTHLDLDLEVNFEKKKISGRTSLTLNNKTGTKTLHLDSRDLTISKVTLDDDETETRFSLGEPVEHLGQLLLIDITPATKTVHVYYSTDPAAAAVQWLEPSQTAGGEKPFLFTQSQSILARTWVPCQDSPGVRITYRARIKTRADLMAVMSANSFKPSSWISSKLMSNVV